MKYQQVLQNHMRLCASPESARWNGHILGQAVKNGQQERTLGCTEPKNSIERSIGVFETHLYDVLSALQAVR